MRASYGPVRPSKEEFLAEYIERTTPAQSMLDNTVVIKCYCLADSCKGWALVSKWDNEWI